MLDVNSVGRTQEQASPEGGAKDKGRIQVADLSAEYSTGQRPDGEWFALGTVRADGVRFDGFPWIVVGTGASRDEAVAQLTEKVTDTAQATVAR